MVRDSKNVWEGERERERGREREKPAPSSFVQESVYYDVSDMSEILQGGDNECTASG